MLNSPLKINPLGAEMSVWKVIARALSVVLLTAFVWVGGAALFNAVKRDTLKLRLDPEVSSDFVLAPIGVSHPSDAVNEMLRPWSENNVLLVIAPTSNPVSMRVMQVYYELLILGYPRRGCRDHFAAIVLPGLRHSRQSPAVDHNRGLCDTFRFRTRSIRGTDSEGGEAKTQRSSIGDSRDGAALVCHLVVVI